MASFVFALAGLFLVTSGVLWYAFPAIFWSIAQSVFGSSRFEEPHAAIHIVSGVVALIAGFGRRGRVAGLAATVFGAFYLLLALGGYVGLADPLGIASDDPTNLPHLLFGLFGTATSYWWARERRLGKKGLAGDL
jgi:hypothetical protein